MAKKKIEPKSSVKSYQQSIDLEKQKMSSYTKKMGMSIRSFQEEELALRGEFKKHSEEMKEAARNIIREGNRNMSTKIGKFKEEIKNQIKENKEASTRIGNSIKFFLGEINKKKKDFRAYIQGPFTGYIRAFWG